MNSNNGQINIMRGELLALLKEIHEHQENIDPLIETEVVDSFRTLE
ncbi:MAG: hypothetical protein JW776_11745 [Candidatus Lokiarchaeota archaeon]|nr:hypothetical protein [Candidatus Lokiarchaeota archaeon]